MPKKIIGKKIIVKDYWSCDSPLCNIQHRYYETAKRCNLVKSRTSLPFTIVLKRLKMVEAFRLKMMGCSFKTIGKRLQLKGYKLYYSEEFILPARQAQQMVNEACYLIRSCYVHPLYKCSRAYSMNENYTNRSAAKLPFIATNTVYWHLKGKEIDYA